MYLQFLTNSFGNNTGDIVDVMHETEGEYYYYDGFERYCYVYKNEEGVLFLLLTDLPDVL